MAITLVLLGSPPGVRAQTPLGSCYQTVSEPVFLAADLDCSASSQSHVVLADRASLDLRGFTLTAHPNAIAIQCEGKCSVFSSLPGGRVDGAFAGVSGNLLSVRDLTITNGRVGAIARKLQAVNVILADLADAALTGTKKLDVRGSLVERCGSVSGDRLSMYDTSVVDGDGVGGRIVKISDSSIAGSNLDCVHAKWAANIDLQRKVAVRIRRSFLIDCTGAGVFAASIAEGGVRARLIDVTIERNGGNGMSGGDRFWSAPLRRSHGPC